MFQAGDEVFDEPTVCLSGCFEVFLPPSGQKSINATFANIFNFLRQMRTKTSWFSMFVAYVYGEVPQPALYSICWIWKTWPLTESTVSTVSSLVWRRPRCVLHHPAALPLPLSSATPSVGWCLATALLSFHVCWLGSNVGRTQLGIHLIPMTFTLECKQERSLSEDSTHTT